MSSSVQTVASAGPALADRLADVVRAHLELNASDRVVCTEVNAHSNINFVYRVETPKQTLYLKVVPAKPKRFIANLPRERVFSEAAALRRFRELVGNHLVVPEVLFIDRSEMALGMSDVGQGRQVLFSVLSNSFQLLTAEAQALGAALGAVHRGTRGAGSPRPPFEEAIIRQVIFEGLLSPGSRTVLGNHWDDLKTEMQSHNECLVHADLWSKNLLVRTGEPIAIVDFEGAFFGDPAFDLGTLVTVALLPALENRGLMWEAVGFASRMLEAWSLACGSARWAAEVEPRVFRATACFIATRTAGPFPYSLTDSARKRANNLAMSLASSTLNRSRFAELVNSACES